MILNKTHFEASTKSQSHHDFVIHAIKTTLFVK